jgi:hypothetical protein
MQIIVGSVKGMSMELDGVSTLSLLTDRKKPLTVTVSNGHVRVCDDEFNSTIYEGGLLDSEITFYPENCYILFEGKLGQIVTAYKLVFNLTTKMFSFDSRAIERKA